MSSLQRFNVPSSPFSSSSSEAAEPSSKLQRFCAEPECEHTDSDSESASLHDGVSSDSDGGEIAGVAMPVIANLRDEELLCHASTQTARAADRHGTHAKNGRSHARIRNVLKSGCCKCGCAGKFHFAALAETCQHFWSLSKAAQDQALWSLSCASSYSQRMPATLGGDRPQGHQWQLNGVSVCRVAFDRLLGIGNGRLQRATKTFLGRDGRLWSAGRTAVRQAEVSQFFRQVYFSTAETLPER